MEDLLLEHGVCIVYDRDMLRIFVVSVKRLEVVSFLCSSFCLVSPFFSSGKYPRSKC